MKVKISVDLVPHINITTSLREMMILGLNPYLFNYFPYTSIRLFLNNSLLIHWKDPAHIIYPLKDHLRGYQKRVKKRGDLLEICMDEFYKPVNPNQSKPKKTKPNQTKPKPTKMTLKQLPSQTPPKTFENLMEDSLLDLNKSQNSLDKSTIKNITNSFNTHMGKIVSLFHKENQNLMKKVSSQLNLYIQTIIYKYAKTELISLDKPTKEIYKQLTKSTDEYITTIEKPNEENEYVEEGFRE